MKSQTLPVKRRPVPKGMFRRLSAVTRNHRKQRVAAAAAPPSDMDVEDGSSKISRALTIIFLIHIVAIGLIFIHQRFLDGRPADTANTVKTTGTAVSSKLPASLQRSDLPQLSTGEKAYVVKPGDNYTRIAATTGVDEGDLRLLNEHMEIAPSRILKIPPKRIVAQDPPEVAEIREQTRTTEDPGLVEAVDVANAPKAQLIRPNTSQGIRQQAAAAPLTTSGKAYTVQPGDSVWRIANRFKISQDNLMRANGITDARKMKTGMKLVIPQS